MIDTQLTADDVQPDPDEATWRKRFIREVRVLQRKREHELPRELIQHFDRLAERFLAGEIDEKQLRQQIILPWVN